MRSVESQSLKKTKSLAVLFLVFFSGWVQAEATAITHGMQAGDVANLGILDASPIPEIANTQQISGVMSRGRLLP